MTDAVPAPTRSRKFLWIAAIVFLGVAVYAAAQIWDGDPEGDAALPTPDPEPSAGTLLDFPCVESSGKAMRLADLKGKFTAAYFMFTSCSGQCPRMAEQMKKVQTATAGDDDFRIASFSVDPERDQPVVLAKYAQDHGCDRSRWLFLHCEKDDLKKLMVDELKLANPNEPMLHSDRFVLFDKDGEARGIYRPLDDAEWQKAFFADLGRLRAAAH